MQPRLLGSHCSGGSCLSIYIDDYGQMVYKLDICASVRYNLVTVVQLALRFEDYAVMYFNWMAW